MGVSPVTEETFLQGNVLRVLECVIPSRLPSLSVSYTELLLDLEAISFTCVAADSAARDMSIHFSRMGCLSYRGPQGIIPCHLSFLRNAHVTGH